MKEKDVIKGLKTVAKEPPIVSEEKKNALIAEIVQREFSFRKRSTPLEFVLAQIGFVNKMVWFWQGVWILLFAYAVWRGRMFSVSNENLCLLSMAPPLLLLLTVEEIAKIYNRSMLEIEAATKFSLKKVVLTRMLAVSVVNGVLLLGGMVYAGRRMELQWAEVLVYSLTPLVLMTALLLKMMTVWAGEQLRYGAVALYLCMAVVILIGRMERMNFYRQELRGIWLLLLIGGGLAAVWQGRRLGKHLEHCEPIAG